MSHPADRAEDGRERGLSAPVAGGHESSMNSGRGGVVDRLGGQAAESLGSWPRARPIGPRTQR